MQTLTEIITDLDPIQRDNLAGIHVTMHNGAATARLSIALFGPIGFGRSGVTVDTDNLPNGVTVSGAERHPDLMRDLATTVPIDEQIRDLHASNLIGGLDAVRVGPDSGGYRWTIKAHAGSPGERQAWATRNVRRTGRPATMERAEHWNITLPADLKKWAMEHGGAKFVRALLEAERARQHEATS